MVQAPVFICNVDAAGISPNNMIKFYDAIYISSNIYIYGESLDQD